MRLASVLSGVFVVALASPMGLVSGCGSDSSGTPASVAGMLGKNGCEPTGACAAVKSDCLAMADNAGKETGVSLRISQLTLTRPPALLDPTLDYQIARAVTPSLADCNVDGGGTFSWLLQFDFTAGTLKTGGGPPIDDPSTGYCFSSGNVTQNKQTFSMKPALFTDGPKGPGTFSVTHGQDLNVPLYLNASGGGLVILPLHSARIHDVTLSPDADCIGSYNAAMFSAANACMPGQGQHYFTEAGTLDGFITLEQADGVVVSFAGTTLCVLLGGLDAQASLAPNSSKLLVCKRDANNRILDRGDWCSTTDSPAMTDCADAFELGGTFAASGVKILDVCP